MGRRRKISDQQVLELTRRLLWEHGLQITTRTLAAEIGISEGVIFQRFTSKEGLVRAALLMPQIQAVQMIDQATKGKDAREVLENIAVVIFRAFCELLPFYIPLIAHSELERERVFNSRTSPFQLFLDALERHLKTERHSGRIWTESPYTTSYFIVSALHNAALFETITGSSTGIHEGTARDLIGVLWPGLEPRDLRSK